ncbi:MAG: hypothetical protein AAB685_00980 [Patescibacteria group bacterium]
MKSSILATVFFLISPIVIGISLFTLYSIKSSEVAEDSLNVSATLANSGVKIYASLPAGTSTIASEIVLADARPEIIKRYLSYWNSPLGPYAKTLVEISDKYQLDFRLLTAIAQQESNLCKKIPAETFNCWGWGIHSEGTLGFSSFEQGIEEVSKGLREEYLNRGYLSIEEIMSKYTPLSNGSWAYGVSKFMSEMQ